MGLPAAMIGSALIGGGANYLSARNANKPRTGFGSSSTTQRLNPYGGTGTLDAIQNLGGMGLGFGLGNMPFGPSQGQFGAVDLINQAARRGLNLSEIHAPHIPQVQIGEIHGPGSEALDAALERLRTGEGRPSANIRSLGIPVSKMTPEQIATYQPETDPYLKEILEGKFLGENPYLDDVIEGVQEDALRAYSRAVPPQIDANFARGGRLGSNAYQTAQGEAFAGFDRNLRDTVANIRAQDYEAERGRMMQAAGMNIEQVVATRNQLMAARNQDLASAAQLRAQAMALWQQGAIAEAQIYSQLAQQHAALAAEKEFMQAQLEQQINIAQAGMGLEAQVANNQFALAGNAQNMQNLMNLYNVESGLQNERRTGAMAPLSLIGGYADLILPMLAQFGTQTTDQSYRGTQPGAGISPIGSFLTGGLGGAMSSYSLLGGKNDASGSAGASPYTGYQGIGGVNPWGGMQFGNVSPWITWEGI